MRCTPNLMENPVFLHYCLTETFRTPSGNVATQNLDDPEWSDVERALLRLRNDHRRVHVRFSLIKGDDLATEPQYIQVSRSSDGYILDAVTSRGQPATYVGEGIHDESASEKVVDLQAVIHLVKSFASTGDTGDGWLEFD